jgi:hypothetical protein
MYCCILVRCIQRPVVVGRRVAWGVSIASGGAIVFFADILWCGWLCKTHTSVVAVWLQIVGMQRGVFGATCDAVVCAGSQGA